MVSSLDPTAKRIGSSWIRPSTLPRYARLRHGGDGTEDLSSGGHGRRAPRCPRGRGLLEVIEPVKRGVRVPTIREGRERWKKKPARTSDSSAAACLTTLLDRTRGHRRDRRERCLDEAFTSTGRSRHDSDHRCCRRAAYRACVLGEGGVGPAPRIGYIKKSKKRSKGRARA